MQTKHNPHVIAYARLRQPVWIGKREAVKYSFIWHVKDCHTTPLKDLAFVKWKEPHFTYRKLSALATARLNLDSIECNNKYLSLTAKIVLVLKEYSKDFGINAENLPTTHLFRFLLKIF